jgi:hypothetical protein
VTISSACADELAGEPGVDLEAFAAVVRLAFAGSIDVDGYECVTA